MTQTMTLPSCPCGRDMSWQEDIKSWRCLACNPVGENIPVCATQKCRRPLTKLGEPWNCWICLRCNEHPDKVNKKMATMKPDKRESKYVDQPMTDERVRELAGMSEEKIRKMIQESIAEFGMKDEPDPDYPPTSAVIHQFTEDDEEEESVADVQKRVEQNLTKADKPETWIQKAKRLGVQTHHPGGQGMRKKAEIMSDMEKL